MTCVHIKESGRKERTDSGVISLYSNIPESIFP